MKVTTAKLDELEKLCKPRGPEEQSFDFLERWAVRASTVPVLIDEVRRLRAVLAFYADRKNWDAPTRTALAMLDEGKKARAALEET